MMSKQRILFYILFAIAAGVFGFSYVYFVAIPLETAPRSEEDNRKEREELLEKAKAGDALSQYQMALAYRFGDHITPKNDVQSFLWVKKAAEGGHVEAQNDVGASYSHGDGTAVNKQEAVRWFQKAAAAGDVLSQSSLARFYLTGEVVPRNLPLAFELYKKSALAEHAWAQVNLGDMYKNGWGTQRDLDQARYWYLKAREKKPELGSEDSIAQTYLYASPPDYKEGIKWLKLGMDNKRPNSFLEMGNLYKNGISVPQSYSKAGEYYKLASDHGSESAKAYISKIEKECLSRPNDLDRCVLAFGAKNPSVGLKIATIYRNQKNETEYRKWLLDSVSSGNKRAQLMMAVDYANGYGVPRDNIEAYAWYRVASSGLADPLVKSYAKVFNSLFSRMSPSDQAQARQLAQQRILSSIK